MNEITAITAETVQGSSSDNIHIALASAQAEMQALLKNSENPHFKSQYADLASVVDVVRSPLVRHGIAYYHITTETAHGHAVKTVLAHGTSGTSIELTVPLIGSITNMQGYKSAVTYAKRIGLESITGIAPEDDDGNEAVEQSKATPLPDRRGQQSRHVETSGPSVDPDEEIITRLIQRINGAQTLDDLASLWSAVARNFEAKDARAIAAKDARKALLTSKATPIIDDEIPY